MSDKGFLSRFTWREYFLIGELIIWGTIAFVLRQDNAIVYALGHNDWTTVGFALFIGVIATGVLLILIAIIKRIF